MKPFLETTVAVEDLDAKIGTITFVATTLRVFGLRVWTFRKPLL